jgi:NAD dependent epimerase/dehydratase family enzyme
VWLQASTATIYAHRYDAANDERTGIIGGDEPGVPDTWRFSIDVARAWEDEFDEAAVPTTRKVALRSAITMGPGGGGPFDTLLGLVRAGLGGAAGDGRQFVSWVHHDDFTRAVRWLIAREGVEGVVNVSARLDARPGRCPDANRDRIDLEEPPRGARTPAGVGFRVSLHPLGRRRA